MSIVIEPPRSSKPKKTNWEKYGWMYMRASGALLVILIFGHLFTNLWAGEGIKAINFAFVAGRYASPFWQIWDLLQLWLAMIHGTNGLRTIINDYAERDQTRFWLKTVLFSACIFIFGTC